MKQRKLFNRVPGIPALAMAPWVVGYLVIVVAMVFVTKGLLKIE